MPTAGTLRSARAGRFLARPRRPTAPGSSGLVPLRLPAESNGLLYVPTAYRSTSPAPLAVMLHGAGGRAQGGLDLLHRYAEGAGLLLLAPDSRGRTWDVILDGYGPDIESLDRQLSWIFQRYAVDPEHVAIGGFSDGASYALSVGITNGDLFTHVIAFSPGFLTPAGEVGHPELFISHGETDAVLPIERCSRRIVPRLQRAGYDVLYREFAGPHTVPPVIAQEALDWFLAP